MGDRGSRGQRYYLHERELRRPPHSKPSAPRTAVHPSTSASASARRSSSTPPRSPPTPGRKEIENDLSINLKPLTDLIKEPRRLLREAMGILGDKRVTAMLPPTLKTMGRRNLEFFCQEEIEKASPATLMNVLQGKELKEHRERPTEPTVVSTRQANSKDKDDEDEQGRGVVKKLKHSLKKSLAESKEAAGSRGKKRKTEDRSSRSARKHKKKKHKKSKTYGPRSPSPRRAVAQAPSPVPVPAEKTQMELLELEYRAKAIKALLRAQGLDASAQLDEALSLAAPPTVTTSSPPPRPSSLLTSVDNILSSNPESRDTPTIIPSTTAETEPPTEIQPPIPSPPEPVSSSNPEQNQDVEVEVDEAGDASEEEENLFEVLVIPSLPESMEEGEVQSDFEEQEELAVWRRTSASLEEPNSSTDSDEDDRKVRRAWAREGRPVKEEPKEFPEEDLSDVSLVDLSLEDIEVDEEEGAEGEPSVKAGEEEETGMDGASSESESETTAGVDFDEIAVENEDGTLVHPPKVDDDEDNENSGSPEEDDTPLTWYQRWCQSKKIQRVVKTNKMYGSVRSALRREERKRKEASPQSIPLPPEPEVSIPIIGSMEEYEKLFGKPQKPVVEEKEEVLEKEESESDEDQDLWGDIMGTGSTNNP